MTLFGYDLIPCPKRVLMAVKKSIEGTSWGCPVVVEREMVMGKSTWKLAADADIWHQKLLSSNNKSPSQKAAL